MDAGQMTHSVAEDFTFGAGGSLGELVSRGAQLWDTESLVAKGGVRRLL